MLFERLGEFKNFLYSFKGNFARILIKTKSLLVVCIIAIFLPCLVETSFLFGGEIVPEDLKSFQMTMEVSVRQLLTDITGSATARYVGVVPQEDDFREKGIAEGCGCFAEFISLISAYGKAMTYQEAEQQCYERECRTGEKLNCERFHYADLITYFLIGYLSALVIQVVWRHFFRLR